MDSKLGLPFYITIAILLFWWGFYVFVKYNNYHKYQKNMRKIPEDNKNCPDYWTYQGDGQCVNTYNVGTCSTIDTQGLSKSEKCKLSKKCNAPWEGIDDACVK